MEGNSNPPPSGAGDAPKPWILALEAQSGRHRRPRQYNPRIQGGPQSDGSTESDSITETIIVGVGEDIRFKIWSHLQDLYQNPSHGKDDNLVAVILSATGAISNPKIQTARGPKVYEGIHGIVELSGNFVAPEHELTELVGKMKLSFNFSESTIFGGLVIGPLVAAVPVQVVMNVSFFPNGYDENR